MTRYEKGFIEKCAEYGVDGNAVLAHMQKKAGLVGTGTRLAVKIRPKLDPKKLNWFTKLFTTTKRVPTTVRSSAPVTEAIASIGKGGGGVSAALPSTDTAARGMREVTRLSPGKILAALGLAGGAGALGGSAASSGAAPAAASGSAKSILAALLGVGAAGAGAAALSGDDDKSKDSDKDKKKKKSGNK